MVSVQHKGVSLDPSRRSLTHKTLSKECEMMNPSSASASQQFDLLLLKATNKLERLRGTPAYLTHELDRQYEKAFSAFNALWQFQQNNRRLLVEAGLRRSDIGEIASKIGHLHFSWYLRCSDTRFLVESYVFYEAIHARQYYHQDVQLDTTATTTTTASSTRLSQDGTAVAEQQLRYYARFILVCIMLGKKEEAMNLMQEFQALVAAYTMSKDSNATHLQEWPLVLAEVGALLTVDPGMPLPRSPGAALSFRPCCRVWPSGAEAACMPHTPLVHHAVLIGYQHRQVKLAELPIDMLRVMQSLEWMDERLVTPEGGDGSGGGTAAHTHFLSTATPTPIPMLAMEVNQRGGDGSIHGGVAANGGMDGAGGGELTMTGTTDQWLNQSTAGTSPEPGTGGLRVGTTLGSDSNGNGNGNGPTGQTQQPNSAHALQARLSAMTMGTTSTSTGSVSGQRNPPKTLLYRTTTPHALAALHNAAATLPASSPAILLLYLSCSSMRTRLAAASAPQGYTPKSGGHDVFSPQVTTRLPPVPSTSCLTTSLAAAAATTTTTTSLCTDTSGRDLSSAWCLSPPAHVGEPVNAGAASHSGGGSGLACHHHLTVDDLRPLTRHRLMVVADGDVAGQVRSLSGVELGHPVVALLSPRHRPSAFGDATRTGQLFTLFLTLPVSAFCLIMGEHDPPPHTLRALQDAVDESLGSIATALGQLLGPLTNNGGGGGSSGAAAVSGINPARGSDQATSARRGGLALWAHAFQDVLLRQLMCRFVLARAALATHRASTGRPECQPDCVPDLPTQVLPNTDLCVEAVLRVAAVIKRQALFDSPAQVSLDSTIPVGEVTAAAAGNSTVTQHVPIRQAVPSQPSATDATDLSSAMAALSVLTHAR